LRRKFSPAPRALSNCHRARRRRFEVTGGTAHGAFRRPRDAAFLFCVIFRDQIPMIAEIAGESSILRPVRQGGGVFPSISGPVASVRFCRGRSFKARRNGLRRRLPSAESKEAIRPSGAGCSGGARGSGPSPQPKRHPVRTGGSAPGRSEGPELIGRKFKLRRRRARSGAERRGDRPCGAARR
jgi:hypothetical protein